MSNKCTSCGSPFKNHDMKLVLMSLLSTCARLANPLQLPVMAMCEMATIFLGGLEPTLLYKVVHCSNTLHGVQRRLSWASTCLLDYRCENVESDLSSNVLSCLLCTHVHLGAMSIVGFVKRYLLYNLAPCWGKPPSKP